MISETKPYKVNLLDPTVLESTGHTEKPILFYKTATINSISIVHKYTCLCKTKCDKNVCLQNDIQNL